LPSGFATNTCSMDNDGMSNKRKAEKRLGHTSVHVVRVSLHGADPPVWRRLELPSAMTLDVLSETVEWTFAWNSHRWHLFETVYGEFGPRSREGASPASRSDEADVALAQVAGEVGAEIVYAYYDLAGFGDPWRHDIVVEEIMPAVPGVAYPRCTAGEGEETPDECSGGIWAFNAQRAEDAADDPLVGYFVDEVDAELETEMLAHLAKVIVPAGETVVVRTPGNPR
jgi:pRiA4b ORF-3-like protein